MKIKAITANILLKINNKNTIARPQNNIKFKNNLEQDTFQKSDLNFTGINLDYEDEWKVFGYDGYDTKDIKDEIRYRLFNGTLEGDNLVSKDINSEIKPIQNDKYKPLEITYTERKTGKTLRAFPNAQDTPDLNGIRGKTPLNNKSGGKNGITKKLNLLKKCGIDTVVDLRDEGTCNGNIKNTVAECGLSYLNFPIEELTSRRYDENFLEKVTSLFNTINKGDYYIGCANGETRTDLTLGINYVCNAKAKNVPELDWLYTSNPDMNLRQNIKKINSLVENNPQIVKKWGWENYDEYLAMSPERLEKLYMHNKEMKKIGKKGYEAD